MMVDSIDVAKMKDFTKSKLLSRLPVTGKRAVQRWTGFFLIALAIAILVQQQHQINGISPSLLNS